MKKSFYTVIVAALAFFVILASGWYRDNREPNFEGHADIYVRPGMTPDDVIEQIESQASIIDKERLQSVFRKKEVALYIKSGHYVLDSTCSSVYVARMLNNGWQTPVKLTLSGNLRIKSNIAAKIAGQMMVDSATICNALNDDELLEAYGVDSDNVFSILFPATYDMYWDASIMDILDKQKQACDRLWTEANIAKALDLGLDRDRVSILASIVTAESNNAAEMPKIAGVYLNRLKIGMPLQADPTIAFCFDYKLQRILDRHLNVDSPYNTYKHAGLPPGPICVPVREAVEAVLNPDFGGEYGAGGNLYFCANPDFSGTHVFAKTLSRHNANARAFQAELNRRSRAKRGGRS